MSGNERGLIHNSIEFICRKVGISKSYFYSFFSSKEELVLYARQYQQPKLLRWAQMLMEALEMEAQKNPFRTLLGLFALCRDISFIDDNTQNVDYSDNIHLILAEPYPEFKRCRYI